MFHYAKEEYTYTYIYFVEIAISRNLIMEVAYYQADVKINLKVIHIMVWI